MVMLAPWWPGPVLATDPVPIQGDIPDQIAMIELVEIDGHAPSLTFHRSRPVVEPPRRRIDGPYDNLLAVGEGVDSDGACSAVKVSSADGVHLRINGSGQGICRVGIPLANGGKTLDVLSGLALRLRGGAFAVETVTLTDRHGRQATAELPPREAGSSLDQVVSLDALASEVDLRHLVSLVMALPQASSLGELSDLTMIERPVQVRPMPKTGFWVWEYREAMADPGAVLRVCRTQRCQRLFVQMPADSEPEEQWERYADLLSRLAQEGVEAYALDGYPEAVYEPQRLVAKMHRLLSVMGPRPLAGIQLDIEPYALAGFIESRDGYSRYLEAIAQMKAAVQGRTRLSIVMPFWLTSIVAQGRSVGFSVMELADEVAIMSYRTDLEELQAIAADAVRYGDRIGKPVWLSVETRALPVEQHIRLERVERWRSATAYLDRTQRRLVLSAPPSSEQGEWFRLVDRTTVRPERLTYHGRSQVDVRTAVIAVMRRVTNFSLAGVVIHDLTGYRALAPDQP